MYSKLARLAPHSFLYAVAFKRFVTHCYTVMIQNTYQTRIRTPRSILATRGKMIDAAGSVGNLIRTVVARGRTVHRWRKRDMELTD
jgi:hypothetical protein